MTYERNNDGTCKSDTEDVKMTLHQVISPQSIIRNSPLTVLGLAIAFDSVTSKLRAQLLKLRALYKIQVFQRRRSIPSKYTHQSSHIVVGTDKTKTMSQSIAALRDRRSAELRDLAEGHLQHEYSTQPCSGRHIEDTDFLKLEPK